MTENTVDEFSIAPELSLENHPHFDQYKSDFKKLISDHLGTEGAPADFISKFIGSEEIVDKKFNEVSDEYKSVLEGYAKGLNSYAKKFPDKVLYKNLFPLTPKMMLRYGQLQLFIRSKGGEWVGKILSDKTQEDYIDQNLIGSNFIAMNSNKTESGESFLVINTHQPLEGPVSYTHLTLPTNREV